MLLGVTLPQTNLDDRAAGHIARMRGLTHLNLSHTYVGDEGLQVRVWWWWWCVRVCFGGGGGGAGCCGVER